jgi:small subunit ribosomal protein S11
MLKLKEFYQYKRYIVRSNKVLRARLLKKAPNDLLKPSVSILKDQSSNLGQGIIYLKASQNNTIITLTDLKGRVQYVRSCGCLGFNGKKKRSTKFAIESTLLAVIQKAKEFGWIRIAVYLSGFAKGRFYVLACLKKSQLKLSIIRDITPIPHNGCRPKRLRRG